jgi:molybdopterin-guanine dinucleotide biosynthesis protein A
MTGELGAILLAGGRGSRMGGVHKPLLDVGGITLLDAALGAARAAHCDPIVVVGPRNEAHREAARPGALWVREDPPFTGPAAAIVAALPFVDAPWTLVLACDLPRAADVVEALRATPVSGDGMCLTDQHGRRQWLAGLYRTAALREAAAAMPDAGRDAPVRALLGGLTITEVAASGAIAFDIDTWDDLITARREDPRTRSR